MGKRVRIRTWAWISRDSKYIYRPIYRPYEDTMFCIGSNNRCFFDPEENSLQGGGPLRRFSLGVFYRILRYVTKFNVFIKNIAVNPPREKNSEVFILYESFHNFIVYNSHSYEGYDICNKGFFLHESAGSSYSVTPIKKIFNINDISDQKQVDKKIFLKIDKFYKTMERIRYKLWNEDHKHFEDDKLFSELWENVK